jgi:hypothetical protein
MVDLWIGSLSGHLLYKTLRQMRLLWIQRLFM